jgi:phosphatidylinositol 4-kinase type 2
VHPGTTGVTVLEHLERLDAVEQSLSRLGSDETEEEVDVGEASVAKKSKPGPALGVMHGAASAPAASGGTSSSPFSPPGSPPLATVPEIESRRSSVDEEDLVALSKSTSHVEGTNRHSRHRTTISTSGIEWISGETSTSNGKGHC